MIYTKQDLDTVFNYNKTNTIIRVTEGGRTLWDIRNMDKDFLNQNLSHPVQTKQDLDQLKKQVKMEMSIRGIIS
jgi:hypothetical protein